MLDALEAFSLSISVPVGLPFRESLIVVLETLCERLDSPVSAAMSSLIARAEWEPEVRLFLDRVLGHAREQMATLLERAVVDEGLEIDVPIDTALSFLAGPFFYERFVWGRIASREHIPAHVDTLLARWGSAG